MSSSVVLPCISIAATALLLVAPARARGGASPFPMAERPDPVPDSQESESQAADVPYDAWDGEELHPPTTPPPQALPRPVVGRQEHPRRPLELVIKGGTLIPICRAESESNERCGGLQPFAHGGLLALWRVHPHFAWGGGLDRASFRYAPPQRFDWRAGTWFAGLAGRVHGRNEGALDPYLQLDLGWGVVRWSFVDPAGNEIEETATGPTIRIGAGLDYFLLPHVRLGPAVTVAQGVFDRVRRCNTTGDCASLDQRSRGRETASVILFARLTISMGKPQ